MLDIESTVPSEWYSSNESDRNDYETRAENISRLTLPYVMRRDGATSSTSLDYLPSQSFNGMLVNNLKAKMGMALLPPATSSFRLKPDATAMMEIYGEDENAISEISKQLSMNTDIINAEIENQQIRSSLFDIILQQLVVGSVIAEKIENNGVQLHTLKNFVVKLDNQGKPLVMCIKETLSNLPEGIEPKEEAEEYELFTLVAYDAEADHWVLKQDILGEAVGEEVTYKNDKLPFKYLGWTWMMDDKYHRPFAEDYLSDMLQVDALSKLNTEGAVISAKSLLFVNQRGNRTNKKDVAESANGDVLDGSSEDVTALQMQKSHDFNVSNAREQDIKQQLKQAFLDTGSVTRDAERVTAEEIRIMAQQLESSTLAGVYSRMSLDWSKWIVEMVMDELNIKFDAIDVTVLTGLDALGRSQEAQKLDGFMQRVAALQLNGYIKETELINRYASFDGINTVNLVKTKDEVDGERAAAQQAQQAQMVDEQKVATQGKVVEEQAKPQ
ncbi:portal protein [bacterium]|nr:portal protein [bacterium]